MSETQKKFFEIAYKTGTDAWSGLPILEQSMEFILSFPKDAMILDLGCGRGKLDFFLAKSGFKVIGIDNVSEIILLNNQEAKNHGLKGKLGFVEADFSDVPFADSSFDVVIDFGLLQHVVTTDWPKYFGEVTRVLKSGGEYLVVALSKSTSSFYGFKPATSDTDNFEMENVHYHFFSVKEIEDLLGGGFELKDSKEFLTLQFGDPVTFLVASFRKN